MKIISFSVWGNDPVYINGILANAEIAKSIYSDWVVRVYHDNRIPPYCIQQLRGLGADTRLMPLEHPWDGLNWRFQPAGESNVDVFIVRDADSRLNSREKACINEWLKSDKCFHCMRDHFEHNVPIMGGMWGTKKGCIPRFLDLLKRSKGDKKGDDQEFLAKFVWPFIREKALVHDRYHKGMLMVNSQIILWDQVANYNDEENCGHVDSPLYDTNFPHGKVVLRDGTVFNRDNIYEYIPLKNFGYHQIKPFPPHPQIEFGSFVGEVIK